jgi:hypothetical protein
MLTALTWFTPDQLEWAGLAAFITGCFICAHTFVTFWRRWRAAGTELERQLSAAPTVDEHAAQALAAVREKPLIPARGWHVHPCGCWCGTDERKRVCPTHALEAQDIRDMLRLETWERERHEP